MPLTKIVSGDENAESNNNDSMVILYPNPTNGHVTIEAAGMQYIRIVNALGQMIQNVKANSDRMTLDMSRFGTGVYAIIILSSNGTVTRMVNVTM